MHCQTSLGMDIPRTGDFFLILQVDTGLRNFVRRNDLPGGGGLPVGQVALAQGQGSLPLCTTPWHWAQLSLVGSWMLTDCGASSPFSSNASGSSCSHRLSFPPARFLPGWQYLPRQTPLPAEQLRVQHCSGCPGGTESSSSPPRPTLANPSLQQQDRRLPAAARLDPLLPVRRPPPGCQKPSAILRWSGLFAHRLPARAGGKSAGSSVQTDRCSGPRGARRAPVRQLVKSLSPRSL